LKKLSTYSRPNALILSAQNETDPEKRFLLVLGWVLSNWSTVPRKGIMGSKPLNPIIGEEFRCTWTHEDSQTEFVAEQVSHHPPVSAFMTFNEKLGFAYSGFINPKTTFSMNSVEAVMEGTFRIDLLKTKEQFQVVQPSVSVGGILLGEQTIEVFDKCIVMNKQYKATVDFYLGKNNKLDGSVVEIKTGKRLYALSGNINDKVHTTNQETASKKPLFDVTKLPLLKYKVESVSKQSSNSSRRNWHKCVLAISKNDYETAAKEKK